MEYYYIAISLAAVTIADDKAAHSYLCLVLPAFSSLWVFLRATPTEICDLGLSERSAPMCHSGI
jgi:hypothetical protein